MKKITLWSLSCLLVLSSTFTRAQTVNVVTQHNDLNRTGWNNRETVLNTSNVKAGTFGKIFTCDVDDKIYAQPLVVTNVSTSAGTKNVVYVATVNNSLYAFDADNGGAPIWHVNFTPAGGTFRPPNSKDIHASICATYNDFAGGKFGIVGTPVIDTNTNTLYVVSRDADTTIIDTVFNPDVTAYSSVGFFMRLHAIDIRNGSDKVAPVIITAKTPSTAFNAVGGFIFLDPRRNNQRGGLLLTGGIVYITFAAHCDWQNYNGWIVGYDATTLVQKISYSSTPNSAEGGIWMSGAAPAVDAAGNIYVTSGNGGGDPTQLTDRGESVIKLTPNIPGGTLTVSDYFTPKDFATLNSGDLDFPIQVMLIPGTNLVVTGLKDGNLYVMSSIPPGLGGYHTGSDNVMQKILVQTGAQMHSSFAYFGGNTTKYFYQFSEGTALKAYPVLSNSLSTTPVSGPLGPNGLAGAYMSVSSNGGDPASGVLWASHAVSSCNANQNFCPGILRAFNASDVTKELWNSATNPNDAIDTFAKTDCPTIANGKVYIGNNGKQSKLMVYGLAASDPCPGLLNVALKPNNAGAVYSQQINFNDDPVNAGKAFDGTMSTGWHCPTDDVPNGTPAYLQLDLGKQYDICSIVIYFGNANTQNYIVEGSLDNSTYTTLEQVTNNGVPSHSILLEGATYRYIRYRPRNRTDFQQDHIVSELQVFGEPHNPCSKPTGVSWTNSPTSENDGTLNWQAVTGTGNDPTSYNIQYQVSAVSNWRTTTSNTNSVSLHAITCGVDYSYTIQAVCPSGTGNPATGTFSTTACSVNCGILTRYRHADIGEIGIAGSYCYSTAGADTTFTVSASGTGIGGNSDQFQYVFTNLAGDEEVTSRVFSFSGGTLPTTKAGIMMRDSVLVGFASRFAFIGLTKSNGVVFEYRSTPGGSTTTVNISGLTPPYWIKLRKLGTQYSAFISTTGLANSWTQVGTTVNLGFGTGSINVGPAATSTSNAILSTATIDQFHEGGGAPLPITLLSFTASNINNDHVLLRWATSMELNNDHFEIERSKDDGTQFEKISSVKAIGNSDVTQNYSAEDQNPVNGVNLYRLKQVDLDGKTSYSYVVPVNFGVQAEPLVYPNPANSYFTVVAGAEPIREIKLYNVSGKLLQHINNNSNSSTRISLVNLSSGIYIVQIKTASAVYQQKLSKQ